MEEEIIFQKLSKIENAFIGVLALVITTVITLIKVSKAVLKAFKILKAEKAFETYNENLRIVSEKNVTYTFKALTLKKDSEDIFNSMRYAYELANHTNIDAKTISFKMFEIPDDEILLSNLTKFLDFYRVKNGVKINIFLHTPLESEKGIKKQVAEYIERLNIRGAKVI